MDGVLSWLALFVLWIYSSISATHGSQRVTACYVTTWAQYRKGPAKFTIEDINPYLCTHIFYAFANIDAQTLQLTPAEWNDVPTTWDKGNYDRLTSLRTKNPDLKIILSVGGWKSGSKGFSAVVASKVTRQTFINNAITFLRLHNLNGLDLDWEYPGMRDSPREDSEKYCQLLQEMRGAFDADSRGHIGKVEHQRRGLLLTTAVPSTKLILESSSCLQRASRYVDYVITPAYDYHGHWEWFAAHGSPLFSASDDVGLESTLNVNWTASVLAPLVGKEKLLLGLPLFAKTHLLEDAEQLTAGSPSLGPGEKGGFTGQPGMLAYYEIWANWDHVDIWKGSGCRTTICKNDAICNNYIEVCTLLRRGWKSFWDRERSVPFAARQQQWVGYEDTRSIMLKALLARVKGLGGVALWALDLDDFKGRCGQGRYPLVTTVKKAFSQNTSRPQQQRQKRLQNTSSSRTRRRRPRRDVGDVAGNKIDGSSKVTKSQIIEGKRAGGNDRWTSDVDKGLAPPVILRTPEVTMQTTFLQRPTVSQSMFSTTRFPSVTLTPLSITVQTRLVDIKAIVQYDFQLFDQPTLPTPGKAGNGTLTSSLRSLMEAFFRLLKAYVTGEDEAPPQILTVNGEKSATRTRVKRTLRGKHENCTTEMIEADPSDCRYYFQCSSRKLYHFFCGPAAVFDPEVKTCVSPNTMEKCAGVSTLMEEPKDGDDYICVEDGYYRDPGDCNKFYRCTNNIKHFFSCPNGLIFSEDSSSCDFPSAAGDCSKEKETKGQSTESGKAKDEKKVKVASLSQRESTLAIVQTTEETAEEAETGIDDRSVYQRLAEPTRGSTQQPTDKRQHTKNQRAPKERILNITVQQIHHPKTKLDRSAIADRKEEQPIRDRLSTKEPTPEIELLPTLGVEGVAVDSGTMEDPYELRAPDVANNEGSKSETSLFACPHNGYFRDAKDCRKFYHCANGMPYHVTCIGGLVFNHIKGICDWPQRVPDCRLTYGDTYRTPNRLKPEVTPGPEQEQVVVETIHKAASQDAPANDATSAGSRQDGEYTEGGEASGTKAPPTKKSSAGKMATSNLPPVFPGYTPWRLLKADVTDDTSEPTLMSPTSGAGSFIECDPPGFRPDPNNCRIFYICSSDGTEHRFRCAEELVFNLRKGYCEPPSRVPGCRRDVSKRRIVKPRGNHRRHLATTPSTITTTSVPPPATPPTGSVPQQPPTGSSNHMVHQMAPPEARHPEVCQPGVKRPHPFDCGHYFLCSENGDWRMASCSPGRVFNPSNSECDSPSAVPACRFVRLRRDVSGDNEPAGLPILNDKQETVFPEETFESAPGGAFIPAAVAPEEGSPCDHMEEHLVADHNHCAYYYKCVSGYYLRMRCKQGLAFHPQLKLCDWVDSVPTCKNKPVENISSNNNNSTEDNNNNKDETSVSLSHDLKQDLNKGSKGALNDDTSPLETMYDEKTGKGELIWEAHGHGGLIEDSMERVNDQAAGWSQQGHSMDVAEITGFRCPYDGLFSHPYDCGLMYECIGSTQRVLKCPGGLVFNSRRRNCDNIHSVPECLTYQIEAPQFQALPVLYEYSKRYNLFYPRGGSSGDRGHFGTGSGVIQGQEVKADLQESTGPLGQTRGEVVSGLDVLNGKGSSNDNVNFRSKGYSKNYRSKPGGTLIDDHDRPMEQSHTAGPDREGPSITQADSNKPVVNHNAQQDLKSLQFPGSSWIGRADTEDPKLAIASPTRNVEITFADGKVPKSATSEAEVWSDEGELLTGSIENLSHRDYEQEKHETVDEKQLGNNSGVSRNNENYRGEENNGNYGVVEQPPNMDPDGPLQPVSTSFRHHVHGDYGHSGNYKEYFAMPEAKEGLNADDIEEPLTDGRQLNQVPEENQNEDMNIAKRLWIEAIRKMQGTTAAELNRDAQLPVFTCTRSGLFADPEDCQWFFECSSELRATHITCPELLVYNEHSGLCDHPINVPECYDGNLDYDLTADHNMMSLQDSESDQPPNDVEVDMQPMVVNGLVGGKNAANLEEAVGTPCIPGRPIPDPNDCSRYYHCITGGLQITYCPGELLFNQLTHRCDHPRNVPRCAPRAPTYRNDDAPRNDNDVSLEPRWGVEGKKLPVTRTSAQRRIGSGVQCPEGGYVRDDNDCSIFYYCLGPIFYEFRCAAGLAFDSELLQCEWPSKVPGCGNKGSRMWE